MRKGLGLGLAQRVSVVLVPSLLIFHAAPSGADLDIDRYAEILARHTREVPDTVGTRVDYVALGKSEDWRKLIQSLAGSDPAGLETRAEKLAFWINAYNILAIDTVIRAYPIESIRDVGSFFYPVWKRNAGRIGGKDVSLGEIEHEMLRPMGEPRIHMAIVCASTSCPSLRREPWNAETLDAQFADSIRGFLASPGKGMSLDRADRVLHVSKVFDWFEDDFEAQGGVLAFITPYLPDAERGWVSSHAGDIELEYLDYDWKLNELTR